MAAVLALSLACITPAMAAQTRPTTTTADSRTQDANEAAQAAIERDEQVRASLSAVREVLDIGLTDDETGEVLRELRRRAPQPYSLVRRVAAREREVAEARLERVRLLEQRRVADNAGELLRTDNALSVHGEYLEALTTALAAERELAINAALLVDLLDSNLLWIGSAPPIGPTWARDVADGGMWIANPIAWVDVGRSLLGRITDVPVPSGLGTLLIGTLLYFRAAFKKRLVVLGEETSNPRSEAVRPTVIALILTLLIALPLPIIVGGPGVLLASGIPEPFARAVGSGLLAAATVFFVLGFFAHVCRKGGLAAAHFGWNENTRQILLNNLRWLIAVEVAAAFVVTTCDASGEDIYQQGLGRLAFMLGSIALTIFIARTFHPTRGALAAMLPPGGWAWRTRRLWYPALLLVPASLVIAAAAGYYFTAVEVQSRFFTTGIVVLGGIVLYSLLARWLLVARRRLAILQARQKWAARQATRERRDAVESSGEAAPELESPHVDIAAANTQTLTLLRAIAVVGIAAGLWAVWRDVLPALTILDQFSLWSSTSANEAGEVIVERVTIASVLLVLITAVLSFIAARTLPSVLAFAILQRFSLDSGTRYAISTLLRYFVVIVGVVVGLNFLRVEWSRMQWIIAALGVGLGFGLQEIVANFVSGLIILFERPVRVGDTVTVGNISGTVSRLQIRATTITDGDNKEVLVPNKSFITDPVTNWTLSNTITRLVLKVGIAYGSDTAVAHKIICNAVRGVRTVLDKPPPTVFFVGLGDSSLNFEIYVFVDELAKRMPTLHELHVTVERALREAGIDIPFPQRDLNVRILSLPEGAADDEEPENAK